MGNCGTLCSQLNELAGKVQVERIDPMRCARPIPIQRIGVNALHL